MATTSPSSFETDPTQAPAGSCPVVRFTNSECGKLMFGVKWMTLPSLTMISMVSPSRILILSLMGCAQPNSVVGQVDPRKDKCKRQIPGAEKSMAVGWCWNEGPRGWGVADGISCLCTARCACAKINRGTVTVGAAFRRPPWAAGRCALTRGVHDVKKCSEQPDGGQGSAEQDSAGTRAGRLGRIAQTALVR